MDLRQTLVRREHHHVDVLLTNQDQKLAVIIENKTWTTEHDDQLSEYCQIVQHTHPGWLVFGIYLTPHGADPSHEAYLPLSYEAVCKSMDVILKDGVEDPAVRVSIEQYVGMVRRKLLGNDEIVKQCQKIYEKHSRAFDLIWKYRCDAQEQIKATVEALIAYEDRLELDRSRKDWITFGIRDWDTPALLTSTDPTPYGRMLLFEFWNEPRVLNLNLFTRPGPEETSERLREMAKKNPGVFLKPRKYGERHLIFQHRILAYDYYEGVSHREREVEIREHWREFIDKDLPRIDAALRQEAWIWDQ